ncbi:MAG: hypothetical protein KU37_03015 [Sulfuricurvum sp. PC08-66]|nr:MAG: hypothetical protein KU37_03015 [Sulfuricurvum sp. PC08-66]
MLLLGVLFLGLLHAQTAVHLGEDLGYVRVVEGIDFTQEEQCALSPQTILTSTTLSELSKSNQGYSGACFWTRLKLVNDSNETRRFILTHPREINHLFVTRFENDKVVGVHTLGYPDTAAHRSYRSFLNNIEIVLAPHATQTIVTAVTSYDTVVLHWDIYAMHEFLEIQYLSLILMGVFSGIFIMIMLFGGVLYHVTRKRFYLYFLLYLLFGMLSQSSLRYYLFHVIGGLENYYVTGAIFVSLFMLFWHLLALEYFGLKERARVWYAVHLFIVGASALLALLFTGAFFYAPLLGILPYSIYFSMFFVLPADLLFALVVLKRRYTTALYFALATLASKGMFFYFLFTLSGNGEITLLSRYGMSIGNLLSSLFLGLALWVWFDHYQKSLKNAQEEHKKFTMIGSAISFIAHQWRQPLSRMGASLMHLQSDIEHTPQKKLISLKEEVEELVQNVEQINQTIKDIQSLFAIHDKTDVPFGLYDALESAIALCLRDHATYPIAIEKHIARDLMLTGNPKLFEQAMINLLQNSAQAFVEHSIQAPRLELVAHTTPTHLILEIADNAGGIAIKPIESIFELYVSSKKEGTGLGLAIVKKVIEQKFGGTISVRNEGDGVRFRLYFLLRNASHKR